MYNPFNLKGKRSAGQAIVFYLLHLLIVSLLIMAATFALILVLAYFHKPMFYKELSTLLGKLIVFTWSGFLFYRLSQNKGLSMQLSAVLFGGLAVTSLFIGAIASLLIPTWVSTKTKVTGRL